MNSSITVHYEGKHQKEGSIYGLPNKNIAKHLANTRGSCPMLQANNLHDPLGYPLHNPTDEQECFRP